MAVPDTDDTNSSSSPAGSQAGRPSWETAPRPAAAPRQAPAPQTAPPRPAAPSYAAPSYAAPSYAAPAPETPSTSPYYAAPKAAPSAYTPAPAPAASVAPAYDPDVRYDLAGNPIPSSGPSVTAPTLAAPFGYSAGAAAPGGAWPPPVAGGQPQYGGPQYGAQAYRNNSGEQSHLPPELEKLHWHWGAFFFPTFWSRRHGLQALAFIIVVGFALLRGLKMALPAASAAVFLGVYLLYFVAHLGVQVYFGLNGHRIGWRNRHFPGGVEEYFKVQNAWMWWGFGLNIILVPLYAFCIFAVIVGMMMGTAPHHQYRPYSNGDGTSGYSRPGTYGNSSSTYGGGSNYGNSSNYSNSSSDNSSSTGQ